MSSSSSYLRNISPRTHITHNISSSTPGGIASTSSNNFGSSNSKGKSTYQSNNNIPLSGSSGGGGHSSTIGRKQQAVNSNNALSSSHLHGLKLASSSQMTSNLTSGISSHHRPVHRQGSSSNTNSNLNMGLSGGQFNLGQKNHGDFEISPKNSSAHQTFSSKSQTQSKFYGLSNRNPTTNIHQANSSSQQQQTSNSTTNQQQMNSSQNQLISNQPIANNSNIQTQVLNDYGTSATELNQILAQHHPQSVKNNSMPLSRQTTQAQVHTSSKDVNSSHSKNNSQNHYGLPIQSQNNQANSQASQQNKAKLKDQNQQNSSNINSDKNSSNQQQQIEPQKQQIPVYDKSQAIRMREKLDQLVQAFEYERMFCDQISSVDNQLKNVVCDLENQRVIRADADRSRGSDNLDKDNIELLLTLYCKRNNLKYKQGINEQCQFDHTFTYNIFSAFLWRYLPTFYQDDEFLTLQAALTLLSLLFKYHDPELAIYLESNQVTPEMYAIPWFLTYFANKFEIEVIIEFWDQIIQEDDQQFIFFFAVALLLQNRKIILESEQSHLPSIMSKITVQGLDELKAVWSRAQQLQESTPYSFKELPEIKHIFSADLKSQKNSEQMQQLFERIENLPCLPVMVEELFFYAYPETLNCSNPKCFNSLNGFKFNQSLLLSGLQSPTMSTQNSIYSMSMNQAQKQLQARRQSLGLEEQHDLMSPIREQSMKQPAQDDSYQVQFQQQQRRMTAADTTNRAQLQLLSQQKKSANIHDIIKKEINIKSHAQQQQLNTRMTSNQTSPIKGQQQQYLQLNDQDYYYKGIDISSSRSPFKNMNKQSPAKADGMPLETDSNVYDDSQEQQESHIDLINETTRMKHLAQTEEQRLLMLRRGQHNQMNSTIMSVQEPRIGSSPKAHLSTYMGSFKQSDKNSNNSMMKQTSKASGYKQGLSSSACKVSKLSNTTNLVTGGSNSLIDNNNKISLIQPTLLQSGVSSINFQQQRLDYCKKCSKKKDYEEKQQFQQLDSQGDSEFQISIQETNQILEEESHEFYYEKIRFLIVDCRLESLQKEALLPNSFQLQIQTECNIEYLQEQTDKLLSCKDIYHVCLVGLDPFQPKISKKIDNNGENFFDIKAYHESIVRFLIEDFQNKGFKYISVIPGGFKECHELSIQYNFQILNHDKQSCYHCDSKSDKHSYDQQYNIAGFSDIFNGFKHWYDVANTKIKSFVKGPIKILGNGSSTTTTQQNKLLKGNQSIDVVNPLMNQTSLSNNNANSSIYSSLVVSKQLSESRNNGPHKQGKHQHKTTEDQNKLLSGIQNQFDQQDNNYQITTGNNNVIVIIQGQDNQSEKASEISLGSLPISFVSQSSRQELFSQFQGSQCSSNVSMNSSQNDGNNLRDAISNKKIMSYKLMSKVPGDRNDIQQYQQASLEDLQQLSKNQVNVQYLVSDQKNNQIISNLNPSMFRDSIQDLQIIVTPPSQRDFDNQSEEGKTYKDPQDQRYDLNDQNTIKVELNQQNTMISGQNRQHQMQTTINLKDQQHPPVVIQLQQEEQKQSTDPAQVMLDYYNINGLSKCFDMTKHEFEMVTTKKTSIVYKCLKLHLRKKQDPPHQVLQQQQLAYHVNLIITPYTVSVIKENLRLKTSMSFIHGAGGNLMNQSVESSLSQLDEWDQTDFDELHPQLKQQESQDLKKRDRIIKQSGNQGPFSYLESRFLMHDLIKITSRKSSTKIITFYFRIPLIADYNSQILESNIVSQLDQKPTIKYQFAFKRKTFKEVSMSFEFSKEDEAKQCIQNVSTIYKKLKNKKQ